MTISGSNIGTPAGFACLLPCPPVVRFGTLEVAAEEQSRSLLTVRTPAHEPGPVDVTVRTPDGRIATAESAFTFSPFPESGYERLLLPIYLDGNVPGSNNSLWATQFWIRNVSANPLTLAPWPCEGQVCLPVFPPSRGLDPGESVMNLPPLFKPPTNNPARLLYVNAEKDVATNLRVFDLSRERVDAGTEIPVVKEHDLLTATAHLLAVPLNERSRLMLRIYELTQMESRFRIRLSIQHEGTAAQQLRDFELTATTNEPGPFRAQPAYAGYSAFQIPQDGPTGLVRFEIEPLSPGVRFWAFVSVTNNETQRVTLITP